MMKARIAAIVALTSIALTANASFAASFPFNGGFERVDKGQPVGWQAEGRWTVATGKACEGNKAVMLRNAFSVAGDRLVSASFRLVGAGETVRLQADYISPTGGAAIGLIPCDLTGQPLGDGLRIALDPIDHWQKYDREITIPADWPAAASAVRVFVGITQDKVAAQFDGVQLSGSGASETVKPALPRLSLFDRPNVLLNAALRCSPDGTVAGWEKAACLGYADTLAQAAAGQLMLGAGSQAVAWISTGVPIDGSVPFVASLKATGDSAEAANVELIAQAYDPADPAAVLVQSSARARVSSEVSAISVELPRVLDQSGPMLARLAIVRRPGAGSNVTVSDVALQPEPVCVAIHAVASAGGFRKPSDVNLFVSAVNNTYDTLQPVAHLKVFDARGNMVCYEPREITVGARSAAHFPLKPKLTGAGDYKLLVRLIANGKDLGSAEFSFSVTPEGPALVAGTPRNPAQ